MANIALIFALILPHKVLLMGFNFPKRVIFNFYTQIMPKRFLVDTMYIHMYVLCKPAGN